MSFCRELVHIPQADNQIQLWMAT